MGAAVASWALDAVYLTGLVLLIPVVILAIGTPMALVVRLLLEIVKKVLGR